MQLLLTLECDRDPIVVCRLMNIFRRKGLEIETLALNAKSESYSLMAVVQSPQTDVDHIFHFLRESSGVLSVAYYRHEPTQDASFIFVESAENPGNIKRIQEAFPECKVVFASHGKYLVEIPSGLSTGAQFPGLEEPGFLPLSRVRASQCHPQMELVGAASN